MDGLIEEARDHYAILQVKSDTGGAKKAIETLCAV